MFLTNYAYPKISCLLVAAPDRFEHFQKSVRCYSNQTYPNLELVVVNEGPKSYQEQIAKHLEGKSNVRLIFLDGKYTLGSLRNISISLCHGDLFVQWDDDDFNAPERIAVQYSYLKRHPHGKVCFLTDQLHYFFNTKKMYWNDWQMFHSGGRKEYSLIPGTIMAYKNDFFARYPSSGKHSSAGEDSILAYDLLKDEDSVVLLNGCGYLHVYSYHGKNVWDEEHHSKIVKERALPISHLLQHRHQLSKMIKCLELEGPVLVTGRDGLAFKESNDIF